MQTSTKLVTKQKGSFVSNFILQVDYTLGSILQSQAKGQDHKIKARVYFMTYSGNFTQGCKLHIRQASPFEGCDSTRTP